MKSEFKTQRLSVGFKFHQFCLIFLTSIVFLSCSEEEHSKEVAERIPSYSVDSLASALPELRAKSTGVFDPPVFIGPYFLEPLQGGDYIAVNDRLEQRILLFDEKGIYLSSAGGEGRGPGEFMGSILIHAGTDQELYGLDLRLNRITQFSVNQEKITYETSYTVNLEPGSWLHNIYVTQWGNFGVIRKNLNYSTGKEAYYLYKLDDSFNSVEPLFEMPGNEKLSLDGRSHIDHIVGQKALWDLDGEWFYHITSHDATINRYNLRTGETSVETFFDLAEREVTKEHRNHLIDFSSNMIRRFPGFRNVIDTVRVLPLFQELMVRDNYIYFVVFDLERSESTELIQLKLSTGDVHYANIPHKLWRIQASNGLLYGIAKTGDGEERVRIIELEDESY